MIDESHLRVSRNVNAEMTELYWQVGTEIENDLLDGKRASYGAQIVRRLSESLTLRRGRGWSVKHIWHCRRLATTFPDYEKVSALRRELSWTNIKTIMYIDDPLKREFYIEMCKLNGWSSRVLEGQHAHRPYPMFGKERRAHRAAGVGRGKHPRG